MSQKMASYKGLIWPQYVMSVIVEEEEEEEEEEEQEEKDETVEVEVEGESSGRVKGANTMSNSSSWQQWLLLPGLHGDNPSPALPTASQSLMIPHLRESTKPP